MGLGAGIGLTGIWLAIAIVSYGTINPLETFWALSGWGFGASVAVIIFV
jgi:hypothetical protein